MNTYKFVNESGASIEVLGFTEISSEYFKEDALNFARKIHQNTARIKCNCKDSEPTSSVAKLGDTYYLKKLPNSDPHDEDCDLFKPQFGSHNPPEREKNPPKFSPFIQGRKVSKDGGKSSSSSTKNSGTRPHRLYTILAYLLAGVKKPSKDGKKYWMTLNSVHVVGGSTKNWSGRNIYQSEYLTNNIIPNWSLKKALKTPWSKFELDPTKYAKNFKKQAAQAKKSNVPPQYFEIILCDNATKNNNTLSYQQGGVNSSIDLSP